MEANVNGPALGYLKLVSGTTEPAQEIRNSADLMRSTGDSLTQRFDSRLRFERALERATHRTSGATLEVAESVSARTRFAVTR